VKTYKTAVVGATGLVGSEMIRVLVQRKFPVSEWRLFATKNSAGTVVELNGESIIVEDIAKADFSGIEVALFAGGEIASADFAPKFVDAGGVVIDNSAVFRMDPEIPLVVPEVNSHHLNNHKGIIANPNCSTIQMVVVLKPIYDAVGIRRVVISTYQSVSGTGKAAVEELREQAMLSLKGETDRIKPSVYPHPIGFNLLPHIGSFQQDGYTSEEHKMIFETRKMLDDPGLAITATTVRVPTMIGHCETLNIETKKKTTPDTIRELLRNSPGVKLVDDPAKNLYPHTLMAADTDDVFVGRIRKDLSSDNAIEMFIAADNLRKGAALNAVQIAEKRIEMNLL
jgi:aspartate-semialdehyde dehydrogenase